MNTLRVISLGIAVLILTSPAFAKSVFIGIDTSKSNPVVVDEPSANVAGEYVRGLVAKLQPGDVVHIRTFADRSAAHVGSRSVRLGRRHKPETIALQIAQHIRALPSKPPQGAGETQILAFLEFGQFGCDKGPVLIVLLTDAVEDSPSMRGKDLLKGKPLPPPEENILKGCEVVMFGFGRSKDGSIPPRSIKAMHKSWSEWMKKAGASFTAIIDP